VRALLKLACFIGYFVYSIELLSAILYVDVNNIAPAPPYSSWATAATNIQDAVDSAANGDQILVTNGVYQNGGRLAMGTPTTNRVVLDKPVTIQSVSGPAATVIKGYQDSVATNTLSSIRCAALFDGAVMVGFTLSGGAAQLNDSGGGVWCQSSNALLTNCVIVGNAIGGYASSGGGGTLSGTLNHCVLSNNVAFGSRTGGGAYGSVLTDSLLFNNSANFGGGAHSSTLTGCSLIANSASYNAGSGGGAAKGTLTDCLLVGNRAGRGGGAFGALLNHCSLSNNVADFEGGGAEGGTLSRCLVIHNSSGEIGGGAAAFAELINCLVAFNSVAQRGGGAFRVQLNNCTVIANSAGTQGGGTYDCTAENCIIYYNSAPQGSNFFDGTFLNTCAAPASGLSPGSFANDPRFVDLIGGDLRLMSNSPCINAGDSAFVTGGVDLDGNPRVVGGTIDAGAYEFQFPLTSISYAWLHQYGLATDGSVDSLDIDGDGMTTWQEWRAGTVPTNATSALRMLSAVVGVAGEDQWLDVTWQSVPGKRYVIERSTNLAAVPPFRPLESNLVGSPTDTTRYSDASFIPACLYFYRVRLQ
jgi:hypothetical protein